MGDVDTTIGSMVKITGNITSEGNVVIHGMVEKGEVKIDGHLTVGESAQIRGNIHADSVTVLGSVEGNITGDNEVVIGSTGHLKGDVQVGSEFVIERGGVFLGKSAMPERDDAFERNEDEEETEELMEDDENQN